MDDVMKGINHSEIKTAPKFLLIVGTVSLPLRSGGLGSGRSATAAGRPRRLASAGTTATRRILVGSVLGLADDGVDSERDGHPDDQRSDHAENGLQGHGASAS